MVLGRRRDTLLLGRPSGSRNHRCWRDGGLALHLAKSIFGNAWQTLYAGGDPPLDDVVPAQVVHLLYRQLGRLTLPTDANDAMDTQAAEAFAAIEAGTKRTRTA